MMHGRALPPVPGEEVDFLLPTGLMVTLKTTPSSSLRQLKDQLYQEAKKYPLFSHLKDQGFYNFLGVTKDGEKEEFFDEELSLSRLNLYAPVLKLVERKGNLEEKQLNGEISMLIGHRTCMHDFDTMGAEVQDFRRHALVVCEQAVTERANSESTAMRYYYPPNLLDYQPSVDTRNSEITVSVEYLSSDGSRCQSNIQVDLENDPRSVLELALNSKDFRSVSSRLDANSFVLKVVGKEEYFLKEVPIIQYKYVASCAAEKNMPRFSLKLHEDLRPKEKEVFIRPLHAGPQLESASHYGTRSHATTTKAPSEFISIWDLQDTYKIKVLSAKNANPPENQKVFVKAGIYHGREALCAVVPTSKGASSETTEWNEILEFDIPIKDVPRAAKLCFIIFTAKDRGKTKRKKDVVPLAWVNMMVFDYEGQLQTGRQELHAWSFTTELEDEVNFMGTNVCNLSTSECVSLGIEVIPPMHSSSGADKPIMYPSQSQIKKFALEMSQVSVPVKQFKSNTVEFQYLQKVIEGDPLSQLEEQDKELIWKARNVCQQEFPHSLPKLLQSVCWNNRSEVAQVYLMLEKWRQLSPEAALELLDHQYSDIQVRDWAVQCLECLGDNKLIMYLLQLVQALKFEPYLECALGQFLLRRALQNKVIGHFFFWHLRSEMHLHQVWVRFGLMLEAFCRGCGSYRRELIGQVSALTRMQQVTDELQTLPKRRSDEMLKWLKEDEFKSAMENVSSPLDPALRLRALFDDKCKVMDSKMRPLWLVFYNQDLLGDNIFQIFKNGDDLRQDMLTLQIIGIMDSQWKADGLDMRMIPYGCLSMGDQVGLIEVILNASTIAKIQKQSRGARGAFDKKVLLAWLRDKNPTTAQLDKAIENFTLSCAGYCVATYVLGIGDRHSDNIMICENGQLAHIDFGHFLGNFKSKFGVKRERVPFVLTDDFIYIITRGGDRNSREFREFKRSCENAFMKLRNRGDLFINLFSLMLQCGIPELTTPNDIYYIRDALCMGMDDAAALENFRKKIQEAIKNAWSVSFNWYIHNVARAGN